MNSESAADPAIPAQPHFRFFRNWLSLAGFVVALGSLFAFLSLFLLDLCAHFSNPYIDMLTYLVAPAFLVLGLLLLGIGALVQRKQIARATGVRLPVRFDLSRPRDRLYLGVECRPVYCTKIASRLTRSASFS